MPWLMLTLKNIQAEVWTAPNHWKCHEHLPYLMMFAQIHDLNKDFGVLFFSIAHGNKSIIWRVAVMSCLSSCSAKTILWNAMPFSTACAYIYIIVLHVCVCVMMLMSCWLQNLCGNGECFSRFTARSIFSVWFNFFSSYIYMCIFFLHHSSREQIADILQHSNAIRGICLVRRMWEQLECESTFQMWCMCVFRWLNVEMHTYQWNIDDIQRKERVQCSHPQWSVMVYINFFFYPIPTIINGYGNGGSFAAVAKHWNAKNTVDHFRKRYSDSV